MPQAMWFRQCVVYWSCGVQVCSVHWCTVTDVRLTGNILLIIKQTIFVSCLGNVFGCRHCNCCSHIVLICEICCQLSLCVADNVTLCPRHFYCCQQPLSGTVVGGTRQWCLRILTAMSPSSGTHLKKIADSRRNVRK